MKSKFDIVIIIQARSDSQRFPRKILSNIEGKPLLWHIVNRLKKIRCPNIVIATTRRKIDDDIIKIAKDCNVFFYRGKKDDVLDRYYQAALEYKAKIIVRITADCPVIDPTICRQVIKKILSGRYDYVSTDRKTIPMGFDAECFTFSSLKKAWLNAKSKSDREHVTQYIYHHPQIFKIGFIGSNEKNAHRFRLVVDYKEDLVLIRKIYHKLYKKCEIFSKKDIMKMINRDPKLLQINSKYSH